MSFSRIIIFFLTVTVAILAVIIAIVLLLRTIDKNPYSIDVNQAAVVKEMRELQRYETASFTIEKIIEAGTEGNEFRELLFGDRILLIAHGQVIAGFDFSTISDNDVTIEGRKIKVKLPKPQILLTTLDNSQTRVYDRKRGILNRDGKDLESEARLAAQSSIQSAACESGILTQASDNGRKQLSTFFYTLGFSEVTIEIPSGECK